MAGPAIRALELARALAEHCDVTLAAPGPSDVGEAGVALLEAGLADFEPLLEAVRRHDVVVAQRLPPQLLRYVARLPIRFVADLYNPQMIEVLEAVRDGAENSARRAAKSMLGQCAVADLVICASEKQRDLWLGGMAMSGLVDVDRYRVDPTFRSFIDVVPFGLPERAPRGEPAGGQGRVAGHRPRRPGAAVGGRDLALARRDHPDPRRRAPAGRGPRRPPRLPGHGPARRWTRPGCRPAPTPPSPSRASAGWRATASTSTRLGALRGAPGLPARGRPRRVGHHDHLEARFSFRTRVLDHFWAGLPSVLTSGDAMGELVARARPRRARRARRTTRASPPRAPGCSMTTTSTRRRRRGCASGAGPAAGAGRPSRSSASAATPTRARRAGPAGRWRGRRSASTPTCSPTCTSAAGCPRWRAGPAARRARAAPPDVATRLTSTRPGPPAASTRRRVASNTAVQVVGRGATLAMGVASITILTRYLGPDDYGKYTLALLYMQLFGVLADVGLFTTRRAGHQQAARADRGARGERPGAAARAVHRGHPRGRGGQPPAPLRPRRPAGDPPGRRPAAARDAHDVADLGAAGAPAHGPGRRRPT